MQAGPAHVRLLELVLQAGPAADLVQADEGDRDQRGEDHEELQHLVVDRRGQAAERDVDGDDDRRHDDADDDRPAQQEVQDQRERVEVHAGDQDRGERERPRVELVRGGVEALEQVLRHAAHLGAVVERHHHQAEEDHGRDRADPVVVDRRDAVLGTVGRHAEHLGRTEVGGDERQPGDPGGQRAPRQEVVETALDVSLRREPDAEYDGEVRQDNRVVDPVGVEPDLIQVGPPCSEAPLPDSGRPKRSSRPGMRAPPGARTLAP